MTNRTGLLIRGVVPLWLLCFAVGCESEQRQLGPAEGTFASQRLGGVSRDEAFRAAREVFSQYFPVESVDEDALRLRSRPVEIATGDGGASQVREVLGTRSRRRQVAEMQVTPRGGDVVVSCRVRTERLDTTQQRAFRPQAGDDRPANNAPFDAEAGATAHQRESWTPIGRDRQLERQVLDSVRERLQPVAAPSTAPAK